MTINSQYIRSIIDMVEAEDTPPYQYSGAGDKITKVSVDLAGRESERYTKLGRQLKRIEALEKEMKQLKDETKQESRELVADLFMAEDAVLTRVVVTKSVCFELSKDPKATETVKYAQVIKDLSEHLTPDLIKVMEGLIKTHSSQTQKAASLKVTDFKAESAMNEGLGDMWQAAKAKITAYAGKVMNWLNGYDAKINKIKSELGLTESFSGYSAYDETESTASELAELIADKIGYGQGGHTEVIAVKGDSLTIKSGTRNFTVSIVER